MKFVSSISIGVWTSSWSLSKSQTAYYGKWRWNMSIFQIGSRYVDQRTVLSVFSDLSKDLFASYNKQTILNISFLCLFQPNKPLFIRHDFFWKFHSANSSTEIEHSLIASFTAYKFWHVCNSQSKTACMSVVPNLISMAFLWWNLKHSSVREELSTLKSLKKTTVFSVLIFEFFH